MASSYGQYFQNAFGDNFKVGYIKAYFDVTGLCTGMIKFCDGNICSRIRNHIVEAINDQVVLPKAIILVFESDVINDLRHYKPGISVALGKLLEWLANQLHRIITAHKEKLPSKARKFRYPTIRWVEATENAAREPDFVKKFNKCINAVTSLFREMEVLQLHGWESDDSSIVTNGKLNASGLTRYWLRLNESFEIWDRDQMKAVAASRTTGKKNSTSSGTKKQNKYREACSVGRKYSWNPKNTRFKLPQPSKLMI